MTRTKLFIAGAGLLGLALGLYALNPDGPVVGFLTGFLAGVCGVTGAICLGYTISVPAKH
jgi:hypothetical protein